MAAVFLTTCALSYIIALLILPYFMEKNRNFENYRKILISLSILIAILLLLVIAPETELGIPKNVWPLITAIFLMGFA